MRLRHFVFSVVLLTGPVFGQQHVSIPVFDSASAMAGEIAADLYGRGSRGLLLVHGGRFHKESWQKQAPIFARAGFRVLAINFRGDGPNPDGSPGSFGSDEDNAIDVLAAVHYLHKLGATSISAIGGSLGGDAVGNAEARSKDGVFERLVFLASDGGDQPEKLNGRKLFIVARGDTSGSGLRLPEITRNYERTPEPKSLIVLGGSAHAQFIFDTVEGGALMRDLLEFVSRK